MVRTYKPKGLTQAERKVILRENAGSPRWTATHVELLERYRRQDLSWRQIAKRLARSWQSCANKHARLQNVSRE